MAAARLIPGVLLGTQGGEVRFEFPDLEAGQPAMLF